GTTAAPNRDRLAAVLTTLRSTASAPVAVGFGIRTARDVARVARLGADAAVVGSAGVARIEEARVLGRDPVEELRSFVRDLRAPVRTDTGQPEEGIDTHDRP
ncbi:tryptophan synthase subunit alpha, partial [Streptomyces sp. TRM76130]|nr:tryptophan synthase subunit alpha [Streptomyces sp. TRM76130]